VYWLVALDGYFFERQRQATSNTPQAKKHKRRHLCVRLQLASHNIPQGSRFPAVDVYWLVALDGYFFKAALGCRLSVVGQKKGSNRQGQHQATSNKPQAKSKKEDTFVCAPAAHGLWLAAQVTTLLPLLPGAEPEFGYSLPGQ
jgi:hypothetical protein